MTKEPDPETWGFGPDTQRHTETHVYMYIFKTSFQGHSKAYLGYIPPI